MTTTVIDEYILPILTRYIDRYQWSFSMATRLITDTMERSTPKSS